uniref:Uncharacterized protein n=1 Tax=Aegilops tauschii subsp. strangulata TaxID=200361 RepID=A0A453E779_AEGTS
MDETERGDHVAGDGFDFPLLFVPEQRQVTKISVKHKCSSTGRIKNSMTSQGWVAQRTVPLIQSDPTIGCKELLENLQDTYGTTTDYHTVWKGKDIAQKEIYGSMRQSFQYLFNFEAEVEKRSPGNIVEVDMKMVHGTTA